MLVYVVFTLLVVLGFVGLAVDVGRMELNTIQLQAVADDAAMTAAAEYQNGNSAWRTLAVAETTAAASATGLSKVSAALQMRSSLGPYAVDYSSVQATVTQSLPIYFLSLITGIRKKTLTATAVADVQPCSYFASPLPYSLYLASASIATACPVYAVGAITNDSFGNLNADQVKVTGPKALSVPAGSFRVATIYDSPVLPDPLAYITPPVFSACTSGDSNLTISTPRTLYPGTYCGGLTILKTTVTLQPGLYIITGGITVMTGSTLNGAGVTLYFTQGGGSSFGNLLFGTSDTTGPTNLNLSAPADASNGGVPAVVLFADRAWTGGGQLTFHTCTWVGEGIFYARATPVFLWQSSMDHGTYFGMDVYSLYHYAGDLHFIPNFAALPGGNPFHLAATLVQ